MLVRRSNKLPQAPNPLRHDTRVTDIALSPSGVHALTCSIGGTLRLWEVESGSMKMQWKDLEETNSLDELHTVAFTHGGSRRVCCAGRQESSDLDGSGV